MFDVQYATVIPKEPEPASQKKHLSKPRACIIPLVRGLDLAVIESMHFPK